MCRHGPSKLFGLLGGCLGLTFYWARLIDSLRNGPVHANRRTRARRTRSPDLGVPREGPRQTAPNCTRVLASAPPRANATSVLGGELSGPFQRGRGGPGGWWILFEPALHLVSLEPMVPDLAGWRVERMPSLPDTAFFVVAPDWVCEVLSKSTESVDRNEKLTL